MSFPMDQERFSSLLNLALEEDEFQTAIRRYRLNPEDIKRVIQEPDKVVEAWNAANQEILDIELLEKELNNTLQQMETLENSKSDMSQSQIKILEEKISALKHDLKKKNDDADQVVIKNGIQTQIRSFINRSIMDTVDLYDFHLREFTYEGLAEIPDPQYEIPTEPQEKVFRLIENMDGGSIGIAGPRGAGKSTLLRSVLRPSFDQQQGGRKVLPVLAYAPVEYEARDFILHIFSSVCQEVIRDRGVFPQERKPTPESVNEEAGRSIRLAAIELLNLPLLILGKRGVLTLRLISLILIFWGLVFAGAKVPLVAVDVPPTRSAAVTNPSVSTQPTLEVLTTTSLGNAQVSGIASTPTSSPQVNTAWRVNLPSVLTGIPKYLDALGITSKGIFFWGCILLVLSLLPSMPINIRYRDRKMRDEYEYYHKSNNPELVDHAHQWLQEIKFQQSYSSGWSGGLHLPGLEGGIQASRTLAKNQMSLPDIINNYNKFLWDISREYRVIIGIDELDKLESPEQAQRFINEIKAIFGSKNCYYLVTVSENAMSSFERRGMPFRDAFDSAFDTIVYVDYINLETARRLLERRVIGLPVPFLCLCYCISGGLARDLIRTCREVFYLAKFHSHSNHINDLCELFICTDIKMKLRAASVAAKDILPSSDSSQFLEKTYKLESLLSKQDWPEACLAYLPALQLNWDNEGKSEDLVERRLKLSSLCEELHSYIYYTITLHQFFNADLSVEDVMKAEKNEEFDRLTRARQLLASSTILSRFIITDFRTRNGLDLPQLNTTYPPNNKSDTSKDTVVTSPNIEKGSP